MIDRKELVIQTIENILKEVKGTGSISNLAGFKARLLEELKKSLYEEQTFKKNGVQIPYLVTDIGFKGDLKADIAILDNDDINVVGQDFYFKQNIDTSLINRIIFTHSGSVQTKVDLIIQECSKIFDAKNVVFSYVILFDFDKSNIIDDAALLLLRKSLHKKYQNIDMTKLSIIYFNPWGNGEPGYIDV